jgi:general secretion pathway protein D
LGGDYSLFQPIPSPNPRERGNILQIAGFRRELPQQDFAAIAFYLVHRKYRVLPRLVPFPGLAVTIRNMRLIWLSKLVALALLSVAAVAADQAQNVLQLPCTGVSPTGSPCNPSKDDLKKAEIAFSRALKFSKTNHPEEAYKEFDTAARLVPRNVEYLTALAVEREELVSEHLKKGNEDLERNLAVEAQAEFRSALDLDPQNSFAQQRLQESLGEWAPKTAPALRPVQYAAELHAVPKPEKHAFHFRGDSRQLLTQVATSYGINAELDDSIVSHHVLFDLDETDFFTAMQAACEVTGTFWTALEEKQILIAKESPENRRLFERMAMRTFEVSSATTPQELQEITNVLRTIFEIRFVQQQAQSGLLVVRAPVQVLDAASELLENLGRSRPQVMLDVKVFEIDHQLTRTIGVHLPNNFNLFNIPAAALLALTAGGGQSIQSLINQLISGGGINQTNSQGLSALLAQLAGQSGQNSIFSQPLATFGGGLTLMGLSLDMLSAQLSLNESLVKLLDHVVLRAGQGKDTSFKLGQRYPIMNASFAPIFNTSAISQVLQNGSFQAPIPSFTYEDLGLDIKAKPVISRNTNIDLTLEMQLRNLAGQSLNGVPVIANREYKGSISLLDGEPAVVASSVTHSEMLSMMGIPGLGSIPVLNKIATTNMKTAEDDEILIVITPHIVNLEPSQDAEIWLPKQ